MVRSGYQGLVLHAGGFRSADERAARSADAANAFHSGIDTIQCNATSVIIGRPLLTKPVPRLFDCGEFLDVAGFGNGEVQGFAPVDFYHPANMGLASAGCKPPLRGTLTDSTRRDG